MRARVEHRGRSTTTVHVYDAGDATRSAIVDAACAAAGETRDSLFGHHVAYFDTVTVVELFRD